MKVEASKQPSQRWKLHGDGWWGQDEAATKVQLPQILVGIGAEVFRRLHLVHPQTLQIRAVGST